MDRHHLLGLLDKLQSKYDFMDAEYKEFAEAIGGKKKMIEVKVGDMVRIKYEKIETVVDIDDDEFFPTIHVMNKCCGIWKVVDNENRWHGRELLSSTYLHKSDMHIDSIKRLIREYTEGKFIKTHLEPDSNRRYCLLVKDVEIIS
jgi:hypothetical protein